MQQNPKKNSKGENKRTGFRHIRRVEALLDPLPLPGEDRLGVLVHGVDDPVPDLVAPRRCEREPPRVVHVVVQALVGELALGRRHPHLHLVEHEVEVSEHRRAGADGRAAAQNGGVVLEAGAYLHRPSRKPVRRAVIRVLLVHVQTLHGRRPRTERIPLEEHVALEKYGKPRVGKRGERWSGNSSHNIAIKEKTTNMIH